MEQKYAKQVNFAWIDIAVYNETEPDKLGEVAREMGIQTIPALVLLDKSRNVIKNWVGELNPTEAEKTFEQVVK